MITSEPAAARRSYNWSEFLRFVATGGFAAMTNLATRFVLDLFVSFELAILGGYIIGMVIAFVLFQRAIFGNPGSPLRQQLFRFTAVNLFGLVLTIIVSSALARQIFPAIGWNFRPYDVAHFIGVCTPAISSYFLHKHYTYR